MSVNKILILGSILSQNDNKIATKYQNNRENEKVISKR